MSAPRVMVRSLAAFALAATLAWTVPAVADGRTAAGAGEEPALVAALRANGARVLPLGESGGLDGRFVELAEGDPYALYLTPDGHGVAGLLYAPDGTLVTGGQIAAARNPGADDAVPIRPGSRFPRSDDDLLSSNEDAGPVPDRFAHAGGDRGYVADIKGLFERSASAFGFTLGRRGPPVVLFADPACRWSRSAVVQLGHAALEGRLRLRVVPVGVLGAASAREAAAIASAADPALAWFEGPDVGAGPAGGRRIEDNNAVFDRWGANAVPLTVWRGADGRIETRLGDLDDPAAWLEALPHE